MTHTCFLCKASGCRLVEHICFLKICSVFLFLGDLVKMLSGNVSVDECNCSLFVLMTCLDIARDNLRSNIVQRRKT